MASGDTLVVFLPQANEPSSQDYPAILDTRNNHPVLDFDDTLRDEAIFSAVMPQHYGGGAVTVYLHYAMSSANTGDTDWDLAFERIGDEHQSLDTDGWDTWKSFDNNDVPSTNGEVDILACSMALADMA